MKVEATLRFVYATPAQAATAAAALAPDNGGFLSSAAKGPILELRGDATSALGMLRTLEDAITCL